MPNIHGHYNYDKEKDQLLIVICSSSGYFVTCCILWDFHFLSSGRCADSCLSQLGGDEQQDAVAMETGGKHLPSRARYALFVRYGQRRLLQQLVDACR